MENLLSEHDPTGELRRLYELWEAKFHSPKNHIIYERKPNIREQMHMYGKSHSRARPPWTSATINQ